RGDRSGPAGGDGSTRRRLNPDDDVGRKQADGLRLPLRAADAGVWTEAEAAREIQTEGPVKKICIDPGHGGKDPGALGPRGLKEKDVVLAVAKTMAEILKGKVEVLLTRSTDVFLELTERARIANAAKAD